MTLPSGAVTFLFTDIEGSTRLVAAIGDARFGEILARERDLVVGAAIAEGGVPFGNEGDAHFVAFTSASAAIRAAISAQRAIVAEPWPSGPLRVRMGIHTGEAQVVADDYVGLEVHRAARVAAAGHGGQVLATEATRVLAGDPGEAFSLVDLGDHRLKDLAKPERLFQVAADGLETSFPALRTLDATPNNLPPQVTSFVGRAELAQAAALLDRARLLTLTGPGGTGKTRLSLAIAGDCVDRFPGGAWFVPLAPITDPELIGSTIAASMGVLAPGRSPIEQVLDRLHDRQALLVLDNFEQVVEGAPLVGDLLRAAPGLTVVVSSRAPLRIGGEQEFPVPPLSVPPAGASDAETVLASEAGRLFTERAMAVRPGFTLTDDNSADVAQIVRRLDGLPLAIELAAARIRLLSPAAMARRLGERLDLLASDARDLPERQRTLRGAIAWSTDLLAPEDRRLFARLGVFAGGGPIETAESVCALEGDDPATDVFAGLERLAAQSLVLVSDDPHRDVRFTMLETIREYALEQLAGGGEVERMRDRHARAFLDFAGAAAEAGNAGDRGTRLDRFEDEHDNLRAALAWLVSAGRHADAADLLHRTWRFWQMRGHIVEGRARAASVLAMPGWATAPPQARLRALEAAGGLAYWAGDPTDTSVHYGEAVAVARELGDEALLAEALYNHFFAQRPASGTADWIAALTEANAAPLREAIEIWARRGDDAGLARGLWGLGEYHAYRRETDEAEAVTTRALALFEGRGDRFWTSWTHFTRAFSRAVAGNWAGAAEDLGAALRDFRANNDVSGIVLVLAAMASTLLLAGRVADAHAVRGAATRAMAETGLHLATLWPDDFPAPDEHPADPELAAAVALGASWTREAAVDRALELVGELVASAG